MTVNIVIILVVKIILMETTAIPALIRYQIAILAHLTLKMDSVATLVFLIIST